jgi:septum formation protein
LTESPQRLVLASKSISRRQILTDAGVAYEWIDAGVDETKIKHQGLADGKSPDEIAVMLAHAKALRVAEHHSDAIVLGCDQMLVCDGTIFDKPQNLDDARQHLMTFRGTTHTLISAMVLLSLDAPPWEYTDHATLTVRDFTDTFLDGYIKSEGESILTSVGAYRLEGRGIQLFDDIVGNYFIILGLPLLPLLNELRQRGGLEV